MLRNLLLRTTVPALFTLLSGRAIADTASQVLTNQLTADAAALAPTFIAPAAAPADPAGAGRWGALIPWTPHIPAAAAQLPDGRLLTWAGDGRTTFSGGMSTYSAVWDPATGQFAECNNGTHGMFCGGVATLPDGRVFVNGGDSCNSGTSIFDWRSNQWSALPAMNDGRWYNPSVALTDGGIFTVSGSGAGTYTAERWDAATGWRRLPGIGWVKVTSEPGYATAWHPFVVIAPNGKLFHFGPTATMHWIDPSGSGSLAASGQFVPAPEYPKEGAWAMFNEGKILVAGGAANTTNGGVVGTTSSTTSAYTVDLTGATPVVANAASMSFPRQFANSVILPGGEVMVIGGNTNGIKFSDVGAVLKPELWNPRTGAWRTLADLAVPRAYHSVALLLADGRVWSGGGGLGGGDHRDAQLFTPPALLRADGSLAARPVIAEAVGSVGVGMRFNVRATPGLAKFALIKMSGLTHSVNTDLRYLELPFTETSPGNYQLVSHANGNVLPPGNWMLFALDPQGVYSVAKVLLVNPQSNPTITAPSDQFAAIGTALALQIIASVPVNGAAVFAATGLPAGLSIDPASGFISGTPATAGAYHPSVSVTAGNQTASIAFQWTVSPTSLGAGSILREAWRNIGTGVAVTDLTSQLAYPAQPSRVDYPTSFQAPTNIGDGYGQRMRGYVYPPVTGSYQFFIASDDGGSLLLSTDEQPGHAVQIASVPGWSNPNEWTKYAQQASARVTLQAGQRYYVEALMKEGTGGDHLSVGWIVPGTNAVAVIPEPDLSPYVPPTNRVLREVWTDIAGSSLSALTSSPAFPARPNSSSTIDHFEAPSNFADSYGQRLRSTVVAPLTGQYLFYLASDEEGSLRLSTDATPGNAREIAHCAAAVAPRAWTATAAQASAPITLQAGQRYYIEALMKEDSGSDALAAAWQMPGANGPTLLTGDFLSLNNPPVFGALGNQTQVKGENLAFAIPATDPEYDPLTFSATGLPAGLVISATGGIISGAPLVPGVYAVTVAVTDGTTAVTTSFNWTINDTLTLPALSGAPILKGTVVNFTIAGSGGRNARYTWNFGDGTPDSAWSSAGNVTHNFPAAGRYIVTVTATDDTGRVVTSSFAQAIHAPLTAKRPTASSSITFEARASGNPRIWVTNPDADTVTIFDAVTNAKLAETAVAASPRCVALAPDGRVWVSCAEGAAISILSPVTFAVVQTVALPRGSRPFGLAFDPAGANAWVVLENLGRVWRLNPLSGAVVASIDAGGNVRHLSITADSARVLVSRFITPRLPGEDTATVDVSTRGGEVLVINTATNTLASTVTLRHSDKADTVISGRGIPNYLGATTISPDGLSAWVPAKQDNILRGTLRNGLPLTHDNSVRAVASRLDLAGLAEDYPSRLDFDNAGVPSALCYDPFGSYAFVALETNRQVAVVDVWNRREIVRLPVGRAPQGLAISADGAKLFVQNFMDRTVTVHDVSGFLNGGNRGAAALATLNSVANEKLPAPVLKGKQLFYDAADPRLALESYLSCAACHNDGGHDGRVWDFTGFGEGLRNTITLKGHGRHGALHWSGNFDEVQDFENQIRNFAGGSGLIVGGTPNPPLGASNAGRSTDLDALAAYVTSRTLSGSSPARADAATLPAAALAGRSIFKAQNCAGCHGGVNFTNSARNVFSDIGTINPAAGRRLGGPLTGFDVPTLRGLWATAPYLHDGSAVTLAAAVRAHRGVTLTDPQTSNLVAYLSNLDDSIPSAPVPLTIAISTPAAVVAGAFTVTPNFSGPASGFTPASIAVVNGVASNVQGTGSSYTFTVLPGAPGTVTVSLPTGAALDGDGDGSLASSPLVVTAIQNNPATLTDDFSAPTLETNKWRVGSIFGALFGPDDPQLKVAQLNGHLEITPRANFATEEYRGIVSVAAVDLRGAAVSALITPAGGGAVTWLDLAGGGKNFLIFAKTGGTLYLEQVVNGVWDADVVPFDAVQHRFWRIRHELATDRILFEASPDAAAWTTLRAVARAISINALQIEIAAGDDHAEPAVSPAVIDDVRFVRDRAPVVTNPGAQTLARGQSTNVQIQASDPEGQSLTFAASGLPAGLSINAATGLISGTVATTATLANNVTVSVSDGLVSASVSFLWNISALPATWSSNDVGAPALAGSASYAAGTFTVTGSGSDIGAGTSDQFQYVWQPFVGDGEFIARVPTMTNPDSLAKAGVMFRETLLANSRAALMAITPGPNAVFQARATTGGIAIQKTAPRYSAPNNWVRLIREGDIVAGYRGSDGLTWTQVGSAMVPMSRVINVGLAVTSRQVSASETANFDHVRNLAGTLAAPWIGADIGPVGLTEMDRFASGAFTVQGGGAGITGASDSFKFISQSLTGDGEIIARVSSQSNTYAWAKAGVMLRETNAADSRFALMTVTQSYGMYFQTRSAPGAAATSVASPRGVAPNNWVRLVRVGSAFTAYRSSDGVAWTMVGSATISMGATINVGLAVTAQNNALLSTATVDSVQVNRAIP